MCHAWPVNPHMPPQTPPGRPAPRRGTGFLRAAAIIIGIAVLVGGLSVGFGAFRLNDRGLTPIPESGLEYEMSDGEAVSIYSLYRDEATEAEHECTVTDAAGNEVAHRFAGSHQRNDYIAYGAWKPTTGGTVTIECPTGGSYMAGPPLSFGGIFALVGGLLFLVFVGGLGGVLLIVGIVLRSTDRG